MNMTERMQMLLSANASTLAAVDLALLGKVTKPKDDGICVKLWSVMQTHRETNLSRPTIYRLIKSGELETVKVRGVERVKVQSVLDYVNRPTSVGKETEGAA